MTNQFPAVTHNELVASHRERYRVHAQNALAGIEEFKLRDDCGTFYNKVDIHFLAGMERRCNGDRADLYRRITNGEPTPELDLALSAYVERLTGKPAPAAS